VALDIIVLIIFMGIAVLTLLGFMFYIIKETKGNK